MKQQSQKPINNIALLYFVLKMIHSQVWKPAAGVVTTALVLVGLFSSSRTTDDSVVSIAMIGNSIQYYNDLPRLLEAMGAGKLKQTSCLHGNSNFEDHLRLGSGMYTKWQTGQALILDEDTPLRLSDSLAYDYGACTPQQLLFGFDKRLDEIYGQRRGLEQVVYESDDDQIYQIDIELEDDGTNPCLQDEDYYYYLNNLYQENGPPKWDFILVNDNSRAACCTEQRQTSLELLESVYIPWFRKTKATPIFLATYPYWASHRDMSGLTDIPTFASLTYEGYREYYDLVARSLPESQQPRLAPVGFAMLIIWEEKPNIWKDLIHYDEVHLSPSGTFLEGCIVYATIFGRLPSKEVVFSDKGTSHLFGRARRMQPPDDPSKPFPSLGRAQYLYHVAHRVMNGAVPKSLTRYYNNESAYFTPDDSLYQYQKDN